MSPSSHHWVDKVVGLRLQSSVVKFKLGNQLDDFNSRSVNLQSQDRWFGFGSADLGRIVSPHCKASHYRSQGHRTNVQLRWLNMFQKILGKEKDIWALCNSGRNWNCCHLQQQRSSQNPWYWRSQPSSPRLDSWSSWALFMGIFDRVSFEPACDNVRCSNNHCDIS